MDFLVATSPATWIAFLILAIAAGGVAVSIRYRDWKRGWLSEEVERRLAMAPSKSTKRRPSVHDASSRVRLLPLAGMGRVDAVVQYLRKRFISELIDWRSPSLASFVIVVLAVIALFLLARPPTFPDHFPSIA